MVVTEAPAVRRRCRPAAPSFDACGVELGMRRGGVQLRRASARGSAPPSRAPNLSYPNLDFSRYRAQRLFHPIDLAHPGLQLVHEEPYIFVCRQLPLRRRVRAAHR